jgi:hypothetical protein
MYTAENVKCMPNPYCTAEKMGKADFPNYFNGKYAFWRFLSPP